MVKIIQVSAKEVYDSRKEKTIFVMVRTSEGKTFSSSAPNGKSRGKHEAKPYRKNLKEDIKVLKKLSDYFSEEEINSFNDLKDVEDILEEQVGANTTFAFETCVLKALAEEKDKEIWELINPHARKFPKLVGNCIGGGNHSSGFDGRKPDFQEFLLVPDGKTLERNQRTNKQVKKNSKISLGEVDSLFEGEKTDEDAWKTSLNEKEILDVLSQFKIPLGLDIAASSFYKRKKYNYKNPLLKRNDKEQLDYVSNLLKNFDIFYLEDPFDEEDFENFSNLLKKFPDRLIVGDDLTTTNPERLKKAIKKKSINAIIIKPNQIGSLIKVKEVCNLAKKNHIKLVFSHRSGETEENILADLAFGFEADFFKCGITGKEREAKINRLIEIERKLRK